MSETVTHGHSRYTNHGCRCPICKEGMRQYQEKRRFARKRLRPIPAHIKHGASTYTNWSCRCKECVTGWAVDSRKRYVPRRKRKKIG